jgi:serine/threonine protein kinase/predicted Zn-dependent protease
MSLSTSGRTWEEASSPAAVRLARRFEDAWRGTATGRRPEPHDFLTDSGCCPGARLALLRAEMTLRWEGGDRVAAGWYRARYPDLEDESFVALIYEEFCLREEEHSGEPPDPAEYLERYPEVASALGRVLEIHGLVGSGTLTATHPPGPQAVPFPAAGETIAGFRLVEELGRGAFARVFLAQERQLADRPVALKVARAGSREPQTLARLQHTHIVPVHSYRTDPATGLHLLCMPYFGRVTLARVLEDPKVRAARSGSDLVAAVDRLGATEPPPGGRAAGRAALARRSYARAIAWWGARMAEALDHAHDRGVLHRDVKPSNVLVTADGMPMLLDFNLAREAVPGDGEADRSAPGGTLDYMAPEQLEELAEGLSDRVDARSDVFSLGVLLYEALAGTRPFPAPRGAASAAEMLGRAAEDRRAGPPWLRSASPEVPAALQAVVRRCLEPDPDDRYSSAADLAGDLQAVADDRPLRFASEPWPDRTRRWARRHRRALATALPVVLALLGMAALVAQERIDHNRLWAKVKRLYDEGVASELAGDPARAMVQYESAVRLADRPDRPPADPSPAGTSPSGLWASLEELRQQARYRYRNAERTQRAREAADALFVAADPLRFRLTGFGGDLGAATRGLDEVLRPFHVFEPGDWSHRPDIDLLDAPRKARLLAEVNELLFLWAVALDRDGGPEARRKAVEVCDLALGFVTPKDPWQALRGWLAGRPGGGPPPPADAPGAADQPSALACFQWGILTFRQGQRPEAVAWFKKAVRLDEGNYWYQYSLAFALDYPAGNVAAALSHYDAAVALKPRSPWVRFTRAHHYREGHQWPLAMENFQRALSDFRALPEADRDRDFESQTRLELGLARQSLGDLAGARAAYAAVIAADRDSHYAFAARLNRAKLDADGGEVVRARAEFDALLDAKPDDDAARLGRAMLALRVREPSRAEADLSKLLNGDADDDDPGLRADALRLRALARLSLGRAAEAAADADEALRLRPSPLLARLRTRARVALGRPGEVELARPEEVAELPVNGPPLRADLLRLVDRLRSAAAVGSVPAASALEVRVTLAVALSALGDPSAQGEADRAVAFAPMSARALLTRARVHAHAGRLEAARADVERALDLEPDDPRVWELRGQIRARSGDPSGGLADLDRAIALGSEGASVHSARAAALMSLGEPGRALRDWEQALARDPDDPHSFLGRARAFMALGSWEQTLADLEQAAGWADGRPDLGLQIALAYARCLPHRPQHLPRLTALLGRVWADGRKPEP